MNKKVFLFFLLLISFSFRFNAQTLEQIINKYLTSRGQLDKLKTLIIVGEREVLNVGIKSKYVQYIKYPGKFRDDTWIDKMEFSILYNNGKGLIINPLTASSKKEYFKEKSIDRIQSMEKSDIQGLLFDRHKKCKEVSFNGKSTIMGEEFFKIKIITHEYDTIDYYISTRDYLLKQIVYFENSPDQICVKYQKYKKIHGIQVPFEILHFNKVGCFRKEIIKEYLFNQEIDDKLFESN